MKTKLEGFLFGHYDSRGGTTFVESNDQAKAKKKYADSFYFDEDQNDEAMEIANDDFLGPATIESEEEIGDGQDIEYGEVVDGNDAGQLPLWVRVNGDGDDKHQGSPGTYHLQFGGECPDGHEESELGEDAFGVIVIRKEEASKEAGGE